MSGARQAKRLRVVVVCTGNICRSPTAEVVLRQRLEEAGLADRVSVDSAGTYAGHGGESPDRRARDAARRRGYDLSGVHARAVSRDDAEADLLLAMDRGHLRRLQQVFGSHDGVTLFLDGEAGGAAAEVPDPYYGGSAGFEQVLDLIEEGSRRWVERIRAMLADEKTPPVGSGT